MPTLAPITEPQPALGFGCSLWSFPKSPSKAVVCTFSGSASDEHLYEESIHFLRTRINRACDVCNLAEALVVDLTHVDFGAPIPASIIGSRHRLFKDTIGIIVTDCQGIVNNSDWTAIQCARGPVEMFNTMAYALRRKRHDGGARMIAVPQYPLPSTEPVSLDISAVRAETYSWQSADGALNGYLAFHGTYRIGSAGHDDATSIQWAIDEFCERFRPHALILDARQLDYQWGDDLSLLPRDFDIPLERVRVILNPEQTKPFEHAVPKDCLVTDVAAAFEALVDS